MTHEDMERAITFILDRQAHTENQIARVENQIAQILGVQAKMQGDIGLLREAVVGVMAVTQKLTEGQQALEKRLLETDERLRETDERLNAFIVIVEKYITRNGNGRGGAAPSA